MRKYIPNKEIFKNMDTQAIINELLRRGFSVYSNTKNDDDETISSEVLYKDIPKEHIKGLNTPIYIDLYDTIRDMKDDIIDFIDDDELEEEFYDRNIPLNVVDCICELETNDYTIIPNKEFCEYTHINYFVNNKHTFRNHLCDILGLQYIVDNDTLLEELKIFMK